MAITMQLSFGIGDDHSLKKCNHFRQYILQRPLKITTFNFYNMQEGAVINITNNQFLLANKIQQRYSYQQ